MRSYLDTLKNYQLNHNYSELYQKNKTYVSYEDYLHQKKDKYNRSIYQEYIPAYTYKSKNIQPPNESANEITYYPVQRNITQFKDIEVRQKVPVKKKVIEYRDKKQIQLVPKQVIKTDYFAVQHRINYIKQVVPQIKIETVVVPKKITKVQIQPVKKQIIYYPSHLSDTHAVRMEARRQLQRQGVVIQPDAQYLPISLKNNFKNNYTNTYQIKSQSLQKGFTSPLKHSIQTLSETKKVQNSNIPSATIKQQSKIRSPLQALDIQNVKSSIPTYVQSKYVLNDSRQHDYTFSQGSRYKANISRLSPSKINYLT